MNKGEIIEKIAKLEKGLTSSLVNDQMKAGIRAQLEKLRAQLAEREADAGTENADNNKPDKEVVVEKKKKAEKPAPVKKDASKPVPKAKPEPVAKEEKPAPKKDPEPTAKEEKPVAKTEKAQIRKTVTELRACLSSALTLLNGHKASKGPKKRKKVSQVLSDGIVATMKRAIGMELTSEKAGKIKPEQLKKVRDSFKEGLRSLRSALGGIDSENNQFIEDFVKSFNELIVSVEKKQESLKEKQ